MLIRFFSGFGFCNEAILFEKFFPKTSFFIAAFSYGSIEAIEFVLSSKKRIDLILLFSPAFFDFSEEKKEKEILAFKKNKEAYKKIFYRNVLYPSKIDLNQFKCEMDEKKLKKMFNFDWSLVDEVIKRGIKLEVFFGLKDRIISVKKAIDFFQKRGIVYIFKNRGHLLV